MMTPDMEVGKSQPLCEICKITERKYKCPRCEMSTCSLECCRQHKTQVLFLLSL
ncbi:hypothetical protein EON65_28195 [archaeon]|nr:MAG: hypothetical protein EON65_28195 [archaeon]